MLPVIDDVCVVMMTFTMRLRCKDGDYWEDGGWKQVLVVAGHVAGKQCASVWRLCSCTVLNCAQLCGGLKSGTICFFVVIKVLAMREGGAGLNQASLYQFFFLWSTVPPFKSGFHCSGICK
jgi:hypothetical protein